MNRFQSYKCFCFPDPVMNAAIGGNRSQMGSNSNLANQQRPSYGKYILNCFISIFLLWGKSVVWHLTLRILWLAFALHVHVYVFASNQKCHHNSYPLSWPHCGWLCVNKHRALMIHFACLISDTLASMAVGSSRSAIGSNSLANMGLQQRPSYGKILMLIWKK